MNSANRFEIALSFTKGVTAEFVRYMEQCGVSGRGAVYIGCQHTFSTIEAEYRKDST